MKKIIIALTAVFVFVSLNSEAQNLNNLERLNAFKIAFFTRRLNLSSPEAEKFWPVYNEYQKQKNSIQVERTTIIKNFNQNETSLNDNQLTELGDKLVTTMAQESSLAITFHKKLKEVLPPAKVIRFYQVENQYKEQLIRELQGLGPQQRGNLRRGL